MPPMGGGPRGRGMQYQGKPKNTAVTIKRAPLIHIIYEGHYANSIYSVI